VSTNKSIARSAAVIAVATLCSRLLGFVRDVVIARLFGVYVYAQAFVIAFKIPNLLRDFLAEGAANAAFVPVFSEYAARRSKEEFWELANVVLNLLLVILSIVVVLGILGAPLIVRLIAPGFSVEPFKLQTTITLTRIIFPYILLIALAAYCMGLLNSLRHFAVPAFAPCLLNISIIVFALIFGEGIKGLSLGVLVGGVLQLAIQVPVLYKKGFRLRRPRTLRHPAAKTIGVLMLPRLASSCIYQLNNFVDTIFGSLAGIVGEGGVAVLYFSYRLILFPLGIFSTALSQAALPTLSSQALEENPRQLKETFYFSLRASFIVLLPSCASLMALSQPIISLLFRGGKFDGYCAALTAQALFYYSIGLAAYGANRIVQSCFFALKDTLTPAKIALLSLILNIVLNSILMFPLKISGLALATSLSGIISFAVIFSLLRKRLGLEVGALAGTFARVLLASIGMGITCFFLHKIISFGPSKIAQFGALAAVVCAGLISYALFCFILGVQEAKIVFARLLWRRKN
jgi:putative peptidoglycan lipid II flippase